MGEYYVAALPCSDELFHYGILKQRWGVRRFQNSDGSLTPAGRERYGAGKMRTKLNSVKQKASKAAKSAAAYVKERNKMKYPSLMTDEELRKYKVEWRGFHVLRHTFATNCYYKGADVKKLSKLLGHVNVTITYNIYINLYGDCLEELRSNVD